jgi:hypothetical protein
MATYESARSGANFPVYKPAGRGETAVAYGTINLTVALLINDLINFCRVPAGCAIIDGYLIGADIDTGTGVFECDVGNTANGVETALATSLLDSGALNGTAVVNYYNIAGFRIPFNQIAAAGPIAFTRETLIQGKVTVAPNAGGTGRLTCVVYYICE